MKIKETLYNKINYCLLINNLKSDFINKTFVTEKCFQ